jgi:putative endonuclease
MILSADTGCTTNFEQRLRQHETRYFPRCYTAQRLPIGLVFYQEFQDITKAILAERQIKRWSRKKKEALIVGDFELLMALAKCQHELE